MRKLLLMAAVGIAATLTLASGPARALTFTTGPSFDGFSSVIDPSSGLAWVSPNIAAGDDFTAISSLCPGGHCTGALMGLTWASAGQVNAFWSDIGIPLNIFGSYSAIGNAGQLLPSLINALGPIFSETNTILGIPVGHTDFLGGITNDPEVLGLPNTSYMFHFYSNAGSLFDNESAFTFGTGNGFAELPSTFGWFFFTPAVPAVPEPASLALLGAGLIAFSVIRRRSKKTLN